jgi:hypothetical protein
MGFGHSPPSVFSGVTVRVVAPGTEVQDPKTGETITIEKGTMAFSLSGTALCVQEDYDSLKGAIQGIQEV